MTIDFITPFSILTAIGFVIASFLFWRNLKDDFPEEEILTLTIWLALGGFLWGRLVYAILHPRFFLQKPITLFFWSRYPGFSLLGVALGLGGVLGLWGRRKEWDLWQVLDQLVAPCLLMVVFGATGTFLTNQEVYYLGLGILGVLGMVTKKFYLTNYRSFAFYPSGKVGFIGLSLTAIFFSLILPLDFYKRNTLSWEAVGNFVIIMAALGLLYRRSGRKIREDLRKIYAKSNSID